MQHLISTIWETGIANDIYDMVGLLGILIGCLFCIWIGRKYKIEVWKSVIILFAVLSIAFFSIHVIIIDAATYLKEHTSAPTLIMTSIVRVLLLIPMTGFWLGKILKVQWGKLCDMLAFLPMILGGIGAFGCIFAGCCRGYPCVWGIYNPRVETAVFPLPILNGVVMLTIAVYLYIRTNKRKYAVDGLAYPVMLVLFGMTRFGTEFLCDNNKVLMGCSVLAIHALKDLAVGVFVLKLIRDCKRRDFVKNFR